MITTVCTRNNIWIICMWEKPDLRLKNDLRHPTRVDIHPAHKRNEHKIDSNGYLLHIHTYYFVIQVSSGSLQSWCERA